MNDEGEPTWMFRKGPYGVESRIFDSNQIPPGWVDSPAKCEEESAPEPASELDSSSEPEEVPKPKRKYTRKVKNDDGA